MTIEDKDKPQHIKFIRQIMQDIESGKKIRMDFPIRVIKGK
jgi:hypothetical protein